MERATFHRTYDSTKDVVTSSVRAVCTQPSLSSFLLKKKLGVYASFCMCVIFFYFLRCAVGWSVVEFSGAMFTRLNCWYCYEELCRNEPQFKRDFAEKVVFFPTNLTRIDLDLIEMRLIARCIKRHAESRPLVLGLLSNHHYNLKLLGKQALCS